MAVFKSGKGRGRTNVVEIIHVVVTIPRGNQPRRSLVKSRGSGKRANVAPVVQYHDTRGSGVGQAGIFVRTDELAHALGMSAKSK